MSNHTNSFKIYNHKLIIANNQKISRHFIVYIDSDGIYHFTDYHRYIKSPRRRIKPITDNCNNRFKFIVQFLNYIFTLNRITKLNQLDADMVKEFLRLYGLCELPNDDEETHRNKNTVLRCAQYIFDFIELYTRDQKNKCSLKVDELYRWETRRNKYGKVERVKVPDFDIYYRSSSKKIFRDIPNKAFNMLFSHIVDNHKEILGLVMLSSFAGLRPSEACNCRREDSPLGPGILFDIVDCEIWGINIDLTKEYNLRSDLVSVGDIKKERLQKVPGLFLRAFKDTYDIYIKHLEGRKYEADYAPFSINSQGKAMTYTRYWQIFHDIIQNEMIPIYLSNDDPEVVLYGKILMEHNLSPHVFRHWYTVQLVLSGITNPGVLMDLRGDKNPESALTYIKNKGELEKQYQKINSENFDYLLWASAKKYDGF